VIKLLDDYKPDEVIALRIPIYPLWLMRMIIGSLHGIGVSTELVGSKAIATKIFNNKDRQQHPSNFYTEPEQFNRT
jgi:hypothetical protein